MGLGMYLQTRASPDLCCWAEPALLRPLPTALMEVHEDFFLYQGGIYSHTPVSLGRPERYRRHGTHSVKITG